MLVVGTTDAVEVQEVREAVDQFSAVSQRQLHLLKEFTPTRAGSDLDLSLEIECVVDSDPIGLAPQLMANWLGERKTREQTALVDGVCKVWQVAERKQHFEIPMLNVPVSRVFSRVPLCLDLAVLTEQGSWHVDLLGRDRLSIRGPALGGKNRVVVLGHIRRAIRLGGLSLFVDVLQDAGAFVDGLVAHMTDAGSFGDVTVCRSVETLGEINSWLCISGRWYTALAIVEAESWPAG